jgi:electron transfer flavoprotein alpha subunit
MANVLVVAEAAEGKLKKTTHSAVTFARTARRRSGGTYSILVIGAGSRRRPPPRRHAGRGQGARRGRRVPQGLRRERYAPTVAAVGKGFAVVVGTASAFGKDLLPRVAARLGAGYAPTSARSSAEGGKLKYKRPMFAGNAFGIMQRVDAGPGGERAAERVRRGRADRRRSSPGREPVAVEAAPGAGGLAPRVPRRSSR